MFLKCSQRQQLREVAGGLMPHSVFKKLATLQVLGVAVPTQTEPTLSWCGAAGLSPGVRLQIEGPIAPAAPLRIRA